MLKYCKESTAALQKEESYEQLLSELESGSELGSGCGSVGRAVASDTKDPRFKSRHPQNFIYQLYNRKDENVEKGAGNLKKECQWKYLLLIGPSNVN